MSAAGEVEPVGDAAAEASTTATCTRRDRVPVRGRFRRDLERAWAEGFRSSELLKQYTTATMGPCQGAMCGRHLAAFAAARTTEKGATPAAARTTARPPPARCRWRLSPPRSFR